MKVLALTEGPDHVCARYRIEAFAWALAERGYELEVQPLRKDLPGRLRQMRGAGRAGAVILQRKLLPLWQLALLRRRATRLIYDVDDALFQRDSYAGKGPSSWSRTARFWATVYSSDAVITGNDYLKRQAAAYVESERVHVVPTCLEPRAYTPARHHRAGSAARLIWIGQSSTLNSLELIREHLAAAARRLPGLQLRVICDRSIDLRPLEVVPRPWAGTTEADELAEGDIGINWLPDDDWSRGKCGLKVLQFMAAGLPVVANPVGMNCPMVEDGQTGVLASTPGQWADAIARLAADPESRSRMGTAGRERVEQNYSVSVWGPRFADVVDRVVRGPDGEQRPTAAMAEDIESTLERV